MSTLLARCATDQLTYEPVGISFGGGVPPGFRRRRWSTQVHGASAFERAVAAIQRWEVHRSSGLTVEADGELDQGTNVVIAAPLPIGFVDVACRIVQTVDEVDRFGFAYGTLSNHPEQGEEAFLVTRTASGSVDFSVEAVSRSAYRLGRLVPFVTDMLQDQANGRYLRAMERAASD